MSVQNNNKEKKPIEAKNLLICRRRPANDSIHLRENKTTFVNDLSSNYLVKN